MRTSVFLFCILAFSLLLGMKPSGIFATAKDKTSLPTQKHVAGKQASIKNKEKSKKNTTGSKTKTTPQKNSKTKKSDKATKGKTPTNATIMKIILRKLAAYQTIRYAMEIRKEGLITIQQTYYRKPDKIRHESYPKGNETKKRIKIFSGKILKESDGHLFTEGPGGPFKLFKINLDKQPSWKTIFETSAVVKGRKAWQVKFLKPNNSYIRGWFDINTGVILRMEDFPEQGKKPSVVGITKDLRVNEVLAPSLFE